MEKIPVFNFYQWVIVNGGTIRFKDGEFEPVEKLTSDIWQYQIKSNFRNIDFYQKDGVERFIQWDTEDEKFYYYEKPTKVKVGGEQRHIPNEILSLLHSNSEPLTLTQICVLLGIDRKLGRKAIKQLEREGGVIKEDRGYTITPQGIQKGYSEEIGFIS